MNKNPTDSRAAAQGPTKSRPETRDSDHRYQRPDTAWERIQLSRKEVRILEGLASKVRAGLRTVRASLPKDIGDEDERRQRMWARILDWNVTQASPELHPSWLQVAPPAPAQTGIGFWQSLLVILLHVADLLRQLLHLHPRNVSGRRRSGRELGQAHFDEVKRDYPLSPEDEAVIAQAKADRKIRGPGHERIIREAVLAGDDLALLLLDEKPAPKHERFEPPGPDGGPWIEPPEGLSIEERDQFRMLCFAPSLDELVLWGRERNLISDISEPEIRHRCPTIPDLVRFLVNKQKIRETGAPFRRYPAGLTTFTSAVLKRPAWPWYGTALRFRGFLWWHGWPACDDRWRFPQKHSLIPSSWSLPSMSPEQKAEGARFVAANAAAFKGRRQVEQAPELALPLL